MRPTRLTGDRDACETFPLRPVAGNKCMSLSADWFLCPGSPLFLSYERSWGRCASCLATVSFLPGCLCWAAVYCCWYTAWVVFSCNCLAFCFQAHAWFVSHGDKVKRRQADLARLCFTDVAFVQTEGGTLHQQKKIRTRFIVLLALSGWSGTQPAISLRCVCSEGKKTPELVEMVLPQVSGKI